VAITTTRMDATSVGRMATGSRLRRITAVLEELQWQSRLCAMKLAIA
jgi:hypothetical protein